MAVVRSTPAQDEDCVIAEQQILLTSKRRHHQPASLSSYARCAAKIASAVEAGILGMQMFREGSQFYDGDGIVTKGVENTIRNISRLATDGMRKTDAEIIKMMLS